MSGSVQTAKAPLDGNRLAQSFSRLGWWGFWLQVVFGSLPIILMVYYFVFSRSNDGGIRSGLRFIEYLTIANILLLVFTTIWSFRYTRLARQIADPAKRPSDTVLAGIVWTGVTASAVSMLFSMIVMLIEAANLLFYFLKAPQGGMPVIQTSGTEAVHWVSSVDMVSLVALNLMLFAELIVLFFSLRLLHRTTLAGSPDVVRIPGV